MKRRRGRPLGAGKGVPLTCSLCGAIGTNSASCHARKSKSPSMRAALAYLYADAMPGQFKLNTQGVIRAAQRALHHRAAYLRMLTGSIVYRMRQDGVL